jgi:antitoxin VapB
MEDSVKKKKEVRAKLFMNGRSQAVRLPKEFRFEGKEVTLRQVGRGILLEPIQNNIERAEGLRRMFAGIDKLMDGHDFPALDEQPEAEERDPFL